eukprot:1146482-Pelagomonas_calceolata.AAC.3
MCDCHIWATQVLRRRALPRIAYSPGLYTAREEAAAGASAAAAETAAETAAAAAAAAAHFAVHGLVSLLACSALLQLHFLHKGSRAGTSRGTC